MSRTLYTAAVVGAFAIVAASGFAGVMKARAAGIGPANIKYEEQIGGGAPTKVLVDNEVLRATLISMPKGHIRQGGVKRKLDQILIYIDPAKYSHLPTPGTQFDKESQSVVESGKITWHDKESVVGTIRIDEPYRVMYVEIKRPAPISK